MGNLLSGDRLKIGIGFAVLILIVLVAADIWLWQSDDDSGSRTGGDQDVSGGTAVPGLPAPSNADSNNPSSGASINDSVNVEVERGASDTGPGLNAGDTPSLNDQFTLESSGATGGVTTNDGTSVGDTATLEVTEGSGIEPEAPPPPRGGPVNDAQLGDSAGLVVRDADGNIKLQETVK